MKTFAVLGATALIASSASAQSPQFTGYSVTRAINSNGNTQYRVYANFNVSNITFLNAFDLGVAYTGLPASTGSMNAYHSSSGEFTWIPQGTSTASHQNDDSWVTSTGTHVGSQTALDPSFVESDVDGNPIPEALAQPPVASGWYDATPSTANAVAAGSLGGFAGQNAIGGFQILLMNIVRQGDDSTVDSLYRTTLRSGFKLANTTQALFGAGTFTIEAVGPTPGALALLGLAGAFGRRRR